MKVKKPIIAFLFTVSLVFINSCSLQRGFAIARSLEQLDFVIYPHVIKRENNYLLQYQIKDTEKSEKNMLKMLVFYVLKDNKLYFYFDTPSSTFEQYKLTEVPFSEIEGDSGDSLSKFAERDAVYWLNIDYSETKLKIES